MKDLIYNELVNTLVQMIHDKVQLLHAGQVLSWDDTKIPELIEKLKLDIKEVDEEIPAGVMLENKYSKQQCTVINDYGGNVSMILHGDVLVYPKDWLWYHFDAVDV